MGRSGRKWLAAAGLGLAGGLVQAAPVVGLNTLGPTNSNLGGMQVNCCGGASVDVAAVVTMSAGGLLTGIDLQIGAYWAGTTLTMTLLDVDALGRPSGSADAARTFAVSVPAWAPGTFHYPITSIDVAAAGLVFDAGDRFAVVLDNPVPSPNNVVGWAAGSDSSGLTTWVRGSAGVWTGCLPALPCGFDVAMRAWVDPDRVPVAVPEPASAVLALLGLFTLGVSRRRGR